MTRDWFVDCYCYSAVCGRDFPVNSYGPMTLKQARRMRDKIRYNRDTNGIDRVAIVLKSKGQAITPVSHED